MTKKEMTAKELIDILRPEHDRTSCSDEDRNNSFYSRLGHPDWYGRCTRCMWLDIADGVELPEDFDPELAFG